MKTEAVETKSRNQGNTAAKAVGGILLALCLIASLVLNICQAVQASAQNEKVNSFIQGQLERQAKEATITRSAPPPTFPMPTRAEMTASSARRTGTP